MLFVLAFLVSTFCAADFNAGVEAYNKGDFTTALKHWEATAKQTTITNNFEWQPKPSQHVEDAQYALALLYWQGKGVGQDYKKAEEWLSLAALAGHGEAQLKLAYLYMVGLAGKVDYIAAKQLFEKSARQGDVDAQYNLGLIYFKGLGVKQDIGEAKKWLAMPVRQGDKSAIDLLAEINGGSQEASFAPATAPKKPDPPAKLAYPAKTDTASPDEHYTIQLYVSEKQDDVIKVMKKWRPTLHLLITFDKMKGGKRLFVLAYGDYPTITKATQAISTLPDPLKKNKPWVIKKASKR